MKKIMIFAAVAALLSSCRSVAPTYRQADSKILGTAMSIVSNNTADLQVSEKREKFTYTASTTEFLSTSKTNATYDFLEKFGADVLVEPRYEILTTGTNRTINITARPAYITNVKQKPVVLPCCAEKK